jgi:hypothetical protein
MKAKAFRANLAWTHSQASPHLLPLSDQLLSHWFPLHENPPRALYHYTSAEGLLGIVRTQSLWSTHFSYLNDPSEVAHAHSLIQQVLSARLESSPPPLSRELFARSLRAINPHDGMYQYFVTSFCEAADLLGQWRAYSNYGGGYAIGFDARHLQLTADPSPALILRRVVYDHDHQRTLVERTIDETAAALEKACLGQTPNDATSSIALFVSFLRDHFSEFHFSFKNQAYKEEREWRLVVQTDGGDAFMRDLYFRANGGILIPYLALGLGQLAGLPNGRLPLTDIVYGPAIDRSRAVHSLHLLLRKLGHAHVRITSSEVPLRL